MELKIEQLCKCYGTTKALIDFNGTLSQGVYGLLGPNGAGKSTLMNMIAGNLKPDAGAISYNGKDIFALGKEFRGILGFMPQQQGLYESFSGFRFLSYIAALKGMSAGEAKAQIQEVSKAVHLTQVLNQRLGSYSGGMKQRILIAQALLGNPEILILDEPTAGLDPKERIHIRNIISEISSNKIVLWATHVVSDIESIAKEIILIKKGVLIAKDTPQSLLNNICGKVFELLVPIDQVDNIQKQYLVSSITLSANGMLMRVVSDHEPEDHPFQAVQPTLEEEYLYVFAAREES